MVFGHQFAIRPGGLGQRQGACPPAHHAALGKRGGRRDRAPSFCDPGLLQHRNLQRHARGVHAGRRTVGAPLPARTGTTPGTRNRPASPPPWSSGTPIISAAVCADDGVAASADVGHVGFHRDDAVARPAVTRAADFITRLLRKAAATPMPISQRPSRSLRGLRHCAGSSRTCRRPCCRHFDQTAAARTCAPFSLDRNCVSLMHPERRPDPGRSFSAISSIAISNAIRPGASPGARIALPSGRSSTASRIFVMRCGAGVQQPGLLDGGFGACRRAGRRTSSRGAMATILPSLARRPIRMRCIVAGRCVVLLNISGRCRATFTGRFAALSRPARPARPRPARTACRRSRRRCRAKSGVRLSFGMPQRFGQIALAAPIDHLVRGPDGELAACIPFRRWWRAAPSSLCDWSGVV